MVAGYGVVVRSFHIAAGATVVALKVTDTETGDGQAVPPPPFAANTLGSRNEATTGIAHSLFMKFSSGIKFHRY
jgi:hypothetical protein